MQQDPRIHHARLLKSSYHTNYNSLITLYATSSPKFLSYTQRIFTQISNPNVVSWTSLISAFSHSTFSLYNFISMLKHNTVPNQRTLATLLKTCTTLRKYRFGAMLHCLGVKLRFCSEPFCGSALVSFYFKFGMWGDALKVFDEMPERDEVSYSGAVVGLAQNGQLVEALRLFGEMGRCGVRSTVYSVSGALRAVGQMAGWEVCRMIHGHVVVAGFDRDVVVGSALVDGYGKAGIVEDARKVFNENFGAMNLVGWNAMMAGYAQQGDYGNVIELFGLMKGEGLFPDEYSFLAVLSALCNAGLDVETEKWLHRMEVEYGLEPRLEHYTCLVNVMGRASRLADAERIALTMPVEPDAAVWRSLLTSCASFGAGDRARTMAKRLWELDPQDDSAYVIAANVFASTGRLDEVIEMRKMMKDRRVRKESGRSWIEVQGNVHVFLAGDMRHERTKEIYEKLEELMKGIGKLGYVPVWSEILHETEEGKKKETLWYHSEKLAVAFGVVCGATPPGKALRIVKNLRICRDCHEAFKYMSRLLEREIIVRDVNRYHRFLNGSCNCNETW